MHRRELCSGKNRTGLRYNSCPVSVASSTRAEISLHIREISELNLPLQIPKGQQQALRLLPRASGLRDLSADYSTGQSPQGLQFIKQQTHLTRLCISCFFPQDDIVDDSLSLIGSLLSLVNLDLNLSSSATDSGIRNLSQLTNLQSLRLPVSKYEVEVTGSSMTVFTSLSQLTYLSLIGWPIKDCHVVEMTSLTRLQHIELGDCLNLTAQCFVPLLEFQQLKFLDLVGADELYIEPIVDMFVVQGQMYMFAYDHGV